MTIMMTIMMMMMMMIVMMMMTTIIIMRTRMTTHRSMTNMRMEDQMMTMMIMKIRSMANMSLTVGAEDKTKTVSCYANNLALSETKVHCHQWKGVTNEYRTKVETHTITVLYPPGAPSITGYRTGELVN